MTELIGYVAAFFTITATLPQLIKTLKTRSAGDVSVFMFAFMAAGNILWTTYGVMMHSWSIIIANTAAATMVAINLIYKLRYNK